ncbi:MAG TPA: hypothetical protein ENN14_02155 [Chloroflexi bacterium]|nr:hypothetical protein [Chloroflexota bacterium]
MNRRQKIVLGALALIDLLVITVLLITVMRATQYEAVAPISYLPPCTRRLLTRVEPLGQAQVAWDVETLYVALTLPREAQPPATEAAQYLWELLDVVGETLQTGCEPPQTITLQIIVPGTLTTTYHTAQLSGADVWAWATGELSTEALTAQGRYHEFSTTAPQ